MIIDFHTHLGFHQLYPQSFITEMFQSDELNIPQKKIQEIPN